MAIADYDTLVATVKSYAVRSDVAFSNMIPHFVSLAEERLYNGHSEPTDDDPLFSPPIRSALMEAASTLTVTDGSATLPSDYLFMRKLVRSGDSIGLTYLPPERTEVGASSEGPGTPVYYTIKGSTLEVLPVWSGTLDVLYYRRFPAIGTTNKTGPMIVQHGLAYLEAVLIEAFSWMQEGDLAVGHAAKLRGLVKGYNRAATELRYSGPLRVRQRQPVP